jgi:hypothetical protein
MIDLRFARLILAVVLLSSSIAIPARAAFIGVAGTFTEETGSGGDTFTVGNDALSEADLTMVAIDLSLSAENAYFDPAGSPFTVVGANDVGFDGNFSLTGTQLITLVFSDFQAGELFTFSIDIDDDFGTTQGVDFAGSTLTASFLGEETQSSPQAIYAETGQFTAAAITAITTPEPGTLSSLSLGLIALGMARRRKCRGDARAPRDD